VTPALLRPCAPAGVRNIYSSQNKLPSPSCPISLGQTTNKLWAFKAWVAFHLVKNTPGGATLYTCHYIMIKQRVETHTINTDLQALKNIPLKMHLMLNLHSSSKVIHVFLDDVRNHTQQKRANCKQIKCILDMF